MEAILTTAINFNNAEDVKVYKQFSPEALPDGDRRYSGVAALKVGFRHIVLLDADGYTIAKKPRKIFKSLAIDGEPVIINGPEFKRIGCDEPDLEDDRMILVAYLNGMKDTQKAIKEGTPYRVVWMSHNVDNNGKNVIEYADFADSTAAEEELDARLKTERDALMTELTY